MTQVITVLFQLSIAACTLALPFLVIAGVGVLVSSAFVQDVEKKRKRKKLGWWLFLAPIAAQLLLVTGWGVFSVITKI